MDFDHKALSGDTTAEWQALIDKMERLEADKGTIDEFHRIAFLFNEAAYQIRKANREDLIISPTDALRLAEEGSGLLGNAFAYCLVHLAPKIGLENKRTRAAKGKGKK